METNSALHRPTIAHRLRRHAHHLMATTAAVLTLGLLAGVTPTTAATPLSPAADISGGTSHVDPHAGHDADHDHEAQPTAVDPSGQGHGADEAHDHHSSWIPEFLDSGTLERLTSRVSPQSIGGARLNPGGNLHRVVSLGVDRVAVWVCRAPANSSGYARAGTRRLPITPEGITDWANRVIRQEFLSMSRGRYEPVFTARGYIDLTPTETPSDCMKRALASTDSPFTLALALDNSMFSSGVGTNGRLTDQPGLPPRVTSRGAWIGGDAATGESARHMFVHEIGHTLHWPHNYNGDREYGNKLDVMSGGWPYAHTIAFNRYVAGWLDDANVEILSGASTRIIELSRPLAGGTEMLVVPTGDPLRFVTLEARTRFGADATIAAAGVATHEIDQRRCPQYWPQLDFCPSLWRTFRQVPAGPNGTEHVIAPGSSRNIGYYQIRVLAETPTGFRVMVTTGDPTGNLETARLTAPGEVLVSGWATDPDVAGPIDVHLYVSGRFHSVQRSGRLRRDVQQAMPAAGANAGFAARLALPAGRHEICAFAINQGAGSTNTPLGCRTITVGGNPFGSFDSIRQTGPQRVAVTGWSLDPDTTSPTRVHLYAGGRFVGNLLADRVRDDVARLHPGFGNRRGFTGTITLPIGRHTVCAFAINLASGTTNPQIGCRTVTVGGNPIGNLDGVRITGPRRVTVTGWSLDPDTASPTRVHLYAGGRFVGNLLADQTRDDVARLYPGFGNGRGFTGTVSLPAGTHNLCAFAINIASGTTNPQIGCRTVTVGGNPVGNLEDARVSGPRRVTVTGWSLDPDTTSPVRIHLYAGSTHVGSLVTDQVRADVARVHPGFGNRRGFTGTVELPSGTHQLCAFAINQGPGTTNPRLGCRSITVGGSPRGGLDAVTSPAFARARLSGWALDPDTAEATNVRISRNGTVVATVSADRPHPEAGRSNPGFGERRGYQADIDLGPGANQLCVTALNVGLGTNANLGCITVMLSGNPRGTFDSVTNANGALRVRGWAFDPDSHLPIVVSFTMNGVVVGEVVANTPRADVGRTYPGFGPNRGFDGQVWRWGNGQICAVARNIEAGTNTSLGCRNAP